MGHWAWDELGADPDRPDALPYSPGDHLGDLVLAAQQNVGRGRVVVLGAAACLSNDGIPFSYTFTAPLLCALAADHPTPLVWWRQFLGMVSAGAAVVLLLRQSEPLCVAAAAVALAVTMIACSLFSNARAELLPSGVKTAAQPIIYVDGTHLGAIGKDPWGENGIGRLMRVLAQNNYLPLVAWDLSPARLKRAAMLISIAPARAFSSDEIAVVHDFVEQGGFFLSIVGSPEAGPSRTLLEKLNLGVQPTPVPPWVHGRETIPVGRFRYPSEEQAAVEFYAAWPVSAPPAGKPGQRTIPSGRSLLGTESAKVRPSLSAIRPLP